MGGAEVSVSVAGIIAAFASCRRVLSKVKTKARQKKFKTQSAAQHQEMFLDESLSRAPMEISNEYARGMTACGQPFGVGDAFAQTLLQATLAKLNSGLVDIIQKFLVSKDPSKLKLDYGALSTLSEVSRIETTGALAQLKDRLARALAAQALQNQRRALPAPDKKKKPPKTQERKPQNQENQNKEYVAGVRHANQMHWAVVRPRAVKKRHLSNSSSLSSSSNGSNSASSSNTSNKSSTLCNTPPAPANTQPRKKEVHQSPMQEPIPPYMHRKSPKQGSTTRLPLREENLAHVPDIPRPYPPEYPRQLWSINAEAGSTPAAGPVPRRRAEKPTESFYSLASDSTKLGEIPPHRLLHPYDYEEMARLNAEAEAAGWANVDGSRRLQRPKKGPGLFARMLRITPMTGIAEA